MSVATKALIGGVVTAAVLMPISSAPPAQAAGTYRIVLNGINITPPAYVVGELLCDDVNGTVTMHFSNSISYIAVVEKSGLVTKVDISYGPDYLYDPQQQLNEAYPLGGDAHASRSANTYRITGHVVPYDENTKGPGGLPVPFLYEATCEGLLRDD